MLANYGYKDASGDFFITIDTDKCDGCGDCVTAPSMCGSMQGRGNSSFLVR